nr:hypothetical protein [Tanacetum cinerariifolium]
MESLSPQVVAAAKLPILNLNEFDLWKIRIEQYFLMTDYSLWEVILNSDSPIPTRVVDDKHQLKFNIHNDAKSLIEAIGKRLQKLISQLEILGESLSQEDINLKFLRSLPSEWRTHTLIWKNKGHTQEEGIDYEEVFAPVARIEAIWLFLAYASFMSFIVYQMDVKSAFHYETIEDEVYICQPLGFKYPDYPDKNGFQRGKIDQTLFIKKQKGDILPVQKFGLTYGKSASTPIDTEKPLLKDLDGETVDVHIYRSMIGSLMYLTSSRPDIMFAVCAYARFQVTPKASHLHAVKRIFRYLKEKPHLGLWYPKDSLFNLVAYSDSDYAGAILDRKSITGGCQFLGCRLISWQCKKQTVVATSSTKAEYVAVVSYCAQVLWI